LIFVLLVGGILIALVLVLFLPIRQSPHTDYRPTDAVFRDDDRYWYAGILYNNPDDPAVFVPRRYGFGWTVNFGHPRGKRFLIGLLLLLLLPLVMALLEILFPGQITSYGCHTFGC
jgi:uncharacterized membrane protein